MFINYAKTAKNFNTFVNAPAYRVSFFRPYLAQLFSNQQLIMKISQKTRIYPDYFNEKMVKQFMHANNLQKYKYYILNSKLKQKKVSQKDRKGTMSEQLIGEFPLLKKSLTYLQCYLDWLLKQKLKKNTNQYFKNKFVMENFDMRNPHNWFHRESKIQYIYHHGPTNSGKTSSAIKQLKQLPKDKKGVYMAPLRLLAWEMQQKLGNCNLITGQDKQFRVSNLTSCTIQAVNTNQQYDVAIIDEIQMIGDQQRGWAWTKALLSIKAKRIHLCGDQRALSLVSKLIKQIGGSLEQRRYSRLGKLKLINKRYDIQDISEGDCIIQFSVQTLHKLRRKIKDVLDKKNDLKQRSNKIQQECSQKEAESPSKIALIYGRLPPECRKQQARKFNENIAPYLVATNAIGMGLNLNIKKIIFAGIKRKNSKGDDVQLQEHQIQQIAGRAGRGLNDGYVQCVSVEIFKKVNKALKNVNKTYGINLQVEQSLQNGKQQLKQEDQYDSTNPSQINSLLQHYDQFLKRVLTLKQRKIKTAGIFIQYIFLKRMRIIIQQNYNQKLSLGQIIKRYLSLSLKSQQSYFVAEKKDLIKWINILQFSFNFQQNDTFQVAKVLSQHYNSKFTRQQMHQFAQNFIKSKTVDIPKAQIIFKNNQIDERGNYYRLDRLQANYSILEIYIALWNRYEFIFSNVEQAIKLKEEISKLIKQVLEDQDGFKFNTKSSALKRIIRNQNQNASKDSNIQDIDFVPHSN